MLPMLPPSMNNEIGMAAANEIGRESSSCGSASFGSTTNRLPVRRRLFVDESPENLPPGKSVSQKLADLYAADKERGLREWGFDFSTDMPSTSSNFAYTVINAAQIPKFYTQVRGCNKLATFTPKKDRSSISLVPILLPTDSSSAISVVEPKQTESAVPTSSSLPEIISGLSPKHVDATPLKPKGKKKKAAANDASISGQKLLTNFFPKKRSAAIDSTPNEKKKRTSTGASSGVQDDSANMIRP